ncbi:type I polyketide synthase [Ancylobacter radicis]|uniref:SDR family NAD(P)-dependent oxidoreductase n=1 Tax=Ancylobacter radicis TaxID=2836179 RepID=A0ABS5RB87_9HYPH|nr:type I polyketide synthase [Ancylobacter radicis]MBS9478928.1 SDR family NAD(P)-dependent oxidoreductase [Ancylobacter radicis]
MTHAATGANADQASLLAQPLHDAAIIGCACRLPGARDEAAFWSLLARGECAVTEIPADRWSRERFLHPGRGVPGRAYSFAAGVLDDIFGFDAGAFGLSPREVEQIDPQQRLLLELVREAFEDANLPLSRLAGAPVGVFVGASSLDHSLHFVTDIGAADAHFVTGNALSIIANRISHVFGFTGPSLAIDTACSSSLVAFDRAVKAIESGEIETAVVAGVNVLTSPFNFIGFSRAGMLSPTGRCRPFSGAADGYVRSEGGVVTILTRLKGATGAGITPRAVVMATGTNSDGRTVGIAMPESRAQQRLLDDLYTARAIDPNRLAFIEAHGTGTLVGDPAEARAVGEALGRRRSAPLPIGSVKSNIGHLEPASGLAGLLKALSALERRQLPASLHLDTLNANIDFAALNLAPAAAPVALDPDARLAGISSFGFGGTNAHAVIRLPEADELPAPPPAPAARVLMLSAQSPEALASLAEAYAERLDGEIERSRLAHAAAHGRARLPHRLAVSIEDPEAPARLRRIARGGNEVALLRGIAGAGGHEVAFVFTGNGGQYPGMGHAAWLASAAFRAAIDEIDDIFAPTAGWSLAQAFRQPPDETALAATELVQPLIFALEVAVARALMEAGCRPAAVIGHSVGEVAAAHIAGALSLFDATQLIYWRSRLQGETRGAGTMAFLMASPARAQELIAAAAQPEVVIGAFNAPKGITLSGPTPAVDAVLRLARRQGVVGKRIGIDYPFHSPAMAPLEQPILQALKLLEPRAPTIPFISSLTGAPVSDASLGARYWWDNIRQPVMFDAAMRHLARDPAIGIFLEIGPKPVLTGFVREILADENRAGVVLASLQEKDRTEEDPIERALLAALVNGAQVDEQRLFGPAALPGRFALPATPWNRQSILPPRTSEAVDIIGGAAPDHPLLGARLMQGGREWRGALDIESRPFLADHKVGDSVIVPATGIAEMALAAGRALFGTSHLLLEDFDILAALRLTPGESVETRVYVDPEGHVAISSRTRGTEDWTLNGQGRVLSAEESARAATAQDASAEPADTVLDAEALYAGAARLGLDYGPAFRLVQRAARRGDRITLDLTEPTQNNCVGESSFVLSPLRADAALHGLVMAADASAPSGTAFVPVRFGALQVLGSTAPMQAVLTVRRASPRSLELDIVLRDSAGATVARMEAVRLRALTLSSTPELDCDFRQSLVPVGPAISEAGARLAAHLDQATPAAPDDDALLTDALAYSIAHRAVMAVAGDEARAGERVEVDRLMATGRLAPERRPLFLTLLDLLAEGGLARHSAEEGWQVTADSDLPAPEPLLHEIAAIAPDRAAEIAIGARLAADLPDLLGHTGPIVHLTGLIDHWETASPGARALAEQAAVLTAASAGDGPLSVLLVERHGLVYDALRPLAEDGRVQLTIIPSDAAARPHLADRIRPTANIVLADQPVGMDVDLVIHADPRRRLDPLSEAGTELIEALRPGGALLSLALAPLGFARLVALEGATGPRGRLLAGARGTTEVFVTPAKNRKEPDRGTLTQATLALLANDAASCLVAPHGHELDGDPATPGATVLIYRPLTGDSAASLAKALDKAGRLLETLRASTTPPALRFLIDGDPLGPHPRAAALWAFGRTAINEYPDLDIKLVALNLRLIDQGTASDLARAFAGLPDERELVLDDKGLRAIRLAPTPKPAPAGGASSLRLVMDRPGALDRLHWRAQTRRAPGPGEVEIEIAASALNFRDVMFAQGLIGDEMLENGFAGPSLGFECAGRVLRVGPDVTSHRPGDAVMAFAPAALATHTIIPSIAALPVPAGLSLDAAATLPVAFLTAWYGLVECARLRSGETVLIHGAAGGVGMAAMQIARARGARIIATAGSPEKRALARLLGADAVYDSRDTRFADEVRAQGGCDVVLNSLSGRAMELSLRTLKPFGRFVELGKRDFIANTGIGLRPFARNLSYFGVDADQLIAAQPELVRAMLEELSGLFARGILRPLPYRLFAANDVRAALRLMQGAGHIGKILIRPPSLPASTAPATPFRAAEGVHLVIGGTGGFGREAARWLGGQGAKLIVTASRKGVMEPPLQFDGAEVTAESLDIRDSQACHQFIARMLARHGRIAGIIHTAMVLDDALIRDLDRARFEAVLGPKVDGARNIDAATAKLDLDYFVLFSSATTLVGNPGQSAYVAANAYLEALARRRRSEGRPGLAMAWGAISDVGVLARDGATSEKLSRRLGLGMLSAADALEELGRALGSPDTPAAHVHAPIDWRAARELTVMRGAAFAALRPGPEETIEGAGDGDLLTLIADQSDTEARATVMRLLTHEVARILRLPAESIEPTRALGDIGMDSLMALELDMEMQRRHKVALPMLGLGAGASLQNVGEKLLRKLRPSVETGTGEPILAAGLHLSADTAELAGRHLRVEPAAVEVLKARVAAEMRRDGSLLR